jgi:hypothetical protein
MAPISRCFERELEMKEVRDRKDLTIQTTGAFASVDAPTLGAAGQVQELVDRAGQGLQFLNLVKVSYQPWLI